MTTPSKLENLNDIVSQSVWFNDEYMTLNFEEKDYQGEGCFGVGKVLTRMAPMFYSQLADQIVEQGVRLEIPAFSTNASKQLLKLAVKYYLVSADNMSLTQAMFWENEKENLPESYSDIQKEKLYLLCDTLDMDSIMECHMEFCRSIKA